MLMLIHYNYYAGLAVSYLIFSKGVDHVIQHTSVMAIASPSCVHKKAACLRCNSGICSACCKCFKPKGRPKKINTQEVIQLRRNTSRAVQPKSFVEPPEHEPGVSETIEVAGNILEIYTRMDMDDAYGDINNLPSLKVRKALSQKDGIDDKAFRTIERVFRKGVLGLMKLLLPTKPILMSML